MKNVLLYVPLLTLVLSCYSPKEPVALSPMKTDSQIKIPAVKWSLVNSIDVADINSDLKPGMPTLDLGIYFPSNLDSAYKRVTLPLLMEGINSAKEIYAPAGVQLNLLWVKTGNVDPRFFSIQANETPGVPPTEYANLYLHIHRHPFVLTKEAEMAFRSIVEPDEDNHRTIYIVVLQDVFLPFMEVSEGRNWMIKSVRTGGLSFPPYTYVGTMPSELQGVFTLSNMGRPDRLRKTIAHEIGHKVMNVGHEYNEIEPQSEVFAEGGLMVYGSGEEIPSGKEGRWHRERLHLSPFIYRLKEDGSKEWNQDFKEGGHYYDPIYKDKVIVFKGKMEIEEDW